MATRSAQGASKCVEYSLVVLGMQPLPFTKIDLATHHLESVGSVSVNPAWKRGDSAIILNVAIGIACVGVKTGFGGSALSGLLRA